MRKTKFLRKALILFVVITVLMSLSINSYASTELVLNHGLVAFNKLLIVEDGITYLPLRLAFNLNANEKDPGFNPNYGINIKPFIQDKFVELSMRRKDENGQLIDTGRYVKIEWNDEVKYADDYWVTGNGRITFIKYDVINGVNEINYNRDYEIYNGLEHQIKLIQVDETGDRLFLSLEDIEKIIDFMTDGNNYQVDIITE